MNLIDIIGPDCEKIVLKYKQSFDLILRQKTMIIQLINSYEDCVINKITNN